MTKTVTILGSTGSIGDSTLRVVRSLGNEVNVYGLACRGNVGILKNQIEEFHPCVVAVESSKAITSQEYKDIKKKYSDIEFLEGESGIIELGGRSVDIVISAIVGAAGLRPSLAALQAAKRIALANKETLVMAGDIFMDRVKDLGVELIPVDSEHSAIFSLLNNVSSLEIERIILTASGGSLRSTAIDSLHAVTPEKALAHPTWDMGNKITIDSATLMNKGLEVIEAHHLFDAEYDSIDVIIHPESVVHSMVELIDGAIYAHMGVADMALPILNALKYPEKVKNPFGRLHLEDVGVLNFSAYEAERYPALELCYDAGRKGGTMPAVLNAANEVAVDAFLNNKILFTEIVKIVENTMKTHTIKNNPNLEDIFNADKEAREISNSIIKGDKK